MPRRLSLVAFERICTLLSLSLSLSLVRACVWVARYETVAGRRTRQRRGRLCFSSACLRSNASFLCFVLTKKYDDDDDGTRAAPMMHRRLSTTNDARHACYLNTPRNPARQSANVPRKTTDVVARRSARDCSRSSTSSSKKESRLSTAATRSAIESREVPISSERSSPSSSSSSVPESLGRGTPKRWNNASMRSSVAFKDFVFVRRKKRIDQKSETSARETAMNVGTINTKHIQLQRHKIHTFFLPPSLCFFLTVI